MNKKGKKMKNYKEYLTYARKRGFNPVSKAKWLKLHKAGLA